MEHGLRVLGHGLTTDKNRPYVKTADTRIRIILPGYAKQAMNTDAERKATEIRLRAERRAGQMLSETQKSKGGGDNKSDHRGQREPSDFKKTIDDAGVSPTQAKRWQKLLVANTEEKSG